MTDTTRFFELCAADDADALTAALARAPETFRLRNETGETLYQFAIFRGRTKCAEALVRRGGLALHEAALAGDTARVAALVAAAPWAIDTLSTDGWSVLHMAAFPGHDATVLFLLKAGASPRVMSRAFEQNMAIHAAAAGRRIGKAAYAALVAATSDPDLLQKQGYTALMIAAANGFTDGADVLLEAGADRALKTPDGKTANDIARERGHEDLAARLG